MDSKAFRALSSVAQQVQVHGLPGAQVDGLPGPDGFEIVPSSVQTDLSTVAIVPFRQTDSTTESHGRCKCADQSNMRVVEEWAYINYDLTGDPAAIFFNHDLDCDNVSFFQFKLTPWHGMVRLRGDGLMVIRFNCLGDTENIRETVVWKVSNDTWVGEDYRRRRIQLDFKRKWCWCPKCRVWRFNM